MTSDFQRFEESVRSGHNRWLDDYDLAALDRLAGDERARAEELLIERLKEGGDIRPVHALARLATPSAMAALRAALPGARGPVLASLAAALKQSEPAAALAAALESLRSHDDSVRSQAVQALRGFANDEATEGLLRAVGDSASNVRSLASDALFSRLGLTVTPRRRLMLLEMKLSSPHEALWRPAVAELTAIVEGLRSGRSKEALGLLEEKPEDTPAYLAFLASLRSKRGEADFDLQALDQLGSEDRAWAELALIGKLKVFDPRAPRALAHMRSKLAKEPMREAQRTAEGRFAEELARALS